MNSKGVKKGFFEGLAYPYHLIACYTVSQIRGTYQVKTNY